MRVLLLDIETAPNIAYIWKLIDDYIPPDHVVKHSYILCVSAKWLGEKGVQYASIMTHSPRGMLEFIHSLLDEADVVVHYNGRKFDIPTLNREFVRQRMFPPSRYQQIDMLAVVRSQLKFLSNKLDFVCQQLGIGAKVKHKGMQLWEQCMARDPKAWRVMERYNKRDVVMLEKLYLRMRPWIRNHPNVAALMSKPSVCPVCAGTKIKHSGWDRRGAYPRKRYFCSSHGGWINDRTTNRTTPKTKYVTT